MKVTHWLALTLAGSIAPSSAQALSMPRVFGDYMVLQAGVPVPIWGWTNPGVEVQVRFGSQSKHTKARDDGRWELRLTPLTPSSEPADLIIIADETHAFHEVVVGEVWLCSGQSNMEKPLGEQRGQVPTEDFERELQAADFPLIRLLKVARARSSTPARDLQATWTVCSPTSLNETKFSAAGFFFARRLHEELKVPIGIIDASVGGSSIEPWIPPKSFASAPSLYKWATAAATPGATVSIHQGPTELKLEPSTLFHAMIFPLTPFALRGLLWYQGESNVYAGDGGIYADKMKALVTGWRSAWGTDLPFYYVQLAPLLYHVTRSNLIVSAEALPRFWEAQTASMQLPKTGMIVTTDTVDDLTDIHPPKKKPVGERLARWALNRDYGRKNIEVSGPRFRAMEIKGDQAILHFDHVGGGLITKDKRTPNWFVIAGVDGEFFAASAKIEADIVIVNSPQVAAPTMVRFAWDEAARPNFFNAAGLPAIPFRTDNPFSPVGAALRVAP